MSEDKASIDVVDLEIKRSRLGRLMGLRFVGIGSSVPDNVVRNEDLAELGYDAEWIVKRTGILERRHAEPDTATSDLAVEAAQRCIERAGVDPGQIDLILLGTYTPDQLLPATANIVQDRLGLCAPALELQAACSSFIFAMISAMQYVATGCSRLALVIGADCNSRVVNPADKKTYPLFGDAAGAVLIERGEEDQGLLAFTMGSDGSGGDLLCRPMGGSLMPYSSDTAQNGAHFLHMQGRPVFKWVVRMLRKTINHTLRSAAMTLDDVDLVIFHQANIRIIDSVVKDLQIDRDKVFNNLQRFGNTSSASIPLALDEAYQKGLIKRGDHILFSCFGAGLAWGTALMKW